jgi:glycosyltransferase involved in cell wall biosynthesis
MKEDSLRDEALIARERRPAGDGPLPRASVVIVAYNTPRRILRENLRALARQTTTDFELLVVDNSEREGLERLVRAYPAHYIKLRKNFGLSLARNVGLRHARGEIVIFLDDDAVPALDFVEQHLLAHERHAIAGLRGKALPRTGTIYNRLATQYDLGEDILPYHVNLEGNSSFKKKILQELGGFMEDLAGAGGYEGSELSMRIIRHLGDRNQLIYYPGALIRHDFCGSFRKYVRKLQRHARHRKTIGKARPELFDFIGSYQPPRRPAAGSPRSPLTAVRLALIGKGASLFLRLDGMLTRHGR